MKNTQLFRCLVLLLAFSLTACPTTDPKKKDAKKAAKTPPAQESSEMDFQAFLGRLRIKHPLRRRFGRGQAQVCAS